MTDRPNVLLIMTDEERYPPPYEQDALAEFRRTRLPARQRLRERSLEFHRHYVGATACAPSRTTLFTGQYPSLHGVRHTDGIAKSATDPSMAWLDPDMVPTMGDWFRALGYRTHYRGKWHISHADLVVPGTHRSLAANDPKGVVDTDVVDLYRRSGRLEPFGFSGWVGREPHGADPADTGFVRDHLIADQVCDLLAALGADDHGAPWLSVASFVNPHDVAFSGLGWQALGFPEPDDTVPDIPAPPSQSDSLDDRPACQRQFLEGWPRMLYPQPADAAYRRFYHWLQVAVDEAIGRVLDALEASGLTRDTIVVFTSDHGDLVGAHGGLQQKWHNAYDEALRVPLLVSGPGTEPRDGGVEVPTSHADLLPTLLGMVGADVATAQGVVAEHHVETRALPGRDLSDLVGGRAAEATIDGPVYFMTEDEISQGVRTTSAVTGTPFDPVSQPARIESVITRLATGADDAPELWKLSHTYEELPDHPGGGATAPADDAAPAPQGEWELYNLIADPEERTNLAGAGDQPLGRLRAVLAEQRAAKRLVPRHAPTPG